MKTKQLAKQIIMTSASISLLALTMACQPKSEDEALLDPKDKRTLATKLVYPKTEKQDVVDTYFGSEVADPYRWLEDDRSEQTEAWVKTQNRTTQEYLSGIPYREEIASVVKELLDYERVSAPFIEGQYQYFFKNDGLQDQSILYRQKEGEEAVVFIDPNTFSDDGTVSLSSISFSADGSIAAYQTSTGGSDWRDIYFIDTESMELVGEKLVNIKFSSMNWYKNDGIFYASYDKPEGSELSEKTDQHKLYYHKVGSQQADDTKIYGHVETEKHRYVGGQVSEDSRYLLVSAANSTSGNRSFLKDLSKVDAPWQSVKETIEGDVSLLTSDENTLYLVTNYNAPNSKLVKVNASAPEVSNWQDIIPETEHVLSVSSAGQYLFAEYMVDAISKVYQYSMDGEKIREVSLPGIGNSGSFAGKKDATNTFYTFSNYVTPSAIYSLNLQSGESSLYIRPKISFNSNDYVSTQVFYNSKDGTKVPMIITHHKDTELNGKNPTILYGYGGFNISLSPRFSSTVAAWLKLGGIYAVPNIRGGGEYGKSWHKAGTQMEKQNVFDDFIAAAEYLIAKQYTSSNYLALRGGSNGGLLVGAVMTQRPELAKVALPAVGVLDMLRYHTFTAGAGWAYDYGTSEQSEEMFKYLLGYSPVHQVKANTQYPATLVTTADHDDRVVPAHSFKFISVLQEYQVGDNPVLIRIEEDAGHGAGTPISKTIEQYADIYGFTLYNMGVSSLTEPQ